MRIINVVGARPNFVKIAALMHQYEKHREIEPLLVHTGQHYGDTMDRLFFDQLEIPLPQINLGVGSASHAVQTARIMERFEPVVLDHSPDLVLVVGDVNSTIGCALVATKMGIRIAHVEAGLRSFDRRMPEEINRVLTDAISDYLFVTEPSGVSNLKREGIKDERIFLVGNLMIDTLVQNYDKINCSTILDGLALKDREYILATLHRPSNVDDSDTLYQFLKTFETMARDLPLVFPVHPRTLRNLESFEWKSDISMRVLHSGGVAEQGLNLIEPLGYLDFMRLLKSARLVLTDSGGIQEEATFLKVPCLTLRDNTERPITVEVGTNRLVGTNPETILKNFKDALRDSASSSETRLPELWDGRAADRIVTTLLGTLS